MSQRLLSAQYAVLPGSGEDSFCMRATVQGALLCVADGCGGLGSRRYETLGDHTGAFAGSRLATHALSAWAGERPPMPASKVESELLCRELSSELESLFCSFAQKHCPAGSRIVGSMQRSLPTTLCAAISSDLSFASDLCFLWAGDSRGFVLDAAGLHQCTRDHLRGDPDPFESLYRDRPLSALVSADAPVAVSLRRLRVRKPCVLVVATDGAFGCLPTPMEFEMLLLDTLRASADWDGWERRLLNQLKKAAHDDATVLLAPLGFEGIDAAREAFAARRALLQKRFITPVRRKRRNVDFARGKWQEYRTEYDWTEGGRDERFDWRI